MAAVSRPLHQPHPHPPAHQDYYIFGRKFENEKKSLLLKNSDSFFFYYSFIISCIIQMRVFVALFNAETNKKISLEICLDWTGWKLGIGHSPLHPTPPPRSAPYATLFMCARRFIAGNLSTYRAPCCMPRGSSTVTRIFIITFTSVWMYELLGRPRTVFRTLDEFVRQPTCLLTDP